MNTDNNDAQINEQHISLHRAEIADVPFLERVYGETRREEFAAVGWSEAELQVFLKMQFNLQTKAYEMQFPGAIVFVIEVDGTAVGRLIVRRGAQEIRLIDISLLPEFRGQEIGACLLAELKSEAAATNKNVGVRVLQTNVDAIRFYEKHDFAVAEKSSTHLTMEWRDKR